MVAASMHRVDLAAGRFNFVLSPVLVLSLVLIGFMGVVALDRRRFVTHSTIAYFMLLMAGLCGWFLFTTLTFQDFIQIKRLVLFYIIVASTITFLLLFYLSGHKLKIINDFIHHSLWVYFIFSAMQIMLFVNGKFGGGFAEPFKFVFLQPQTIGPYFPRLTGGFIDPNVGGFFLTFLYILIRHFKVQGRFLPAIWLLVFLTLSRSAILAFLIIAALSNGLEYLRQGRRILIPTRFSLRTGISLVVLLGGIVGGLVYLIGYTSFVLRLREGVEARLYGYDSSTNIHLNLLDLALRKITDNPVNLVKGYGFGSSFLHTQEFFPGNKYGNFHSELLSILFETGLVGLLLFLLALLVPVLYVFVTNTLSRNFTVILIGVAIFLQGIFYQQYLFQYYWLMVCLMWALPFLKNPVPARSLSPEAS
jgi:O-antigen ligase